MPKSSTGTCTSRKPNSAGGLHGLAVLYASVAGVFESDASNAGLNQCPQRKIDALRESGADNQLVGGSCRCTHPADVGRRAPGAVWDVRAGHRNRDRRSPRCRTPRGRPRPSRCAGNSPGRVRRHAGLRGGVASREAAWAPAARPDTRVRRLWWLSLSGWSDSPLRAAGCSSSEPARGTPPAREPVRADDGSRSPPGSRLLRIASRRAVSSWDRSGCPLPRSSRTKISGLKPDH